MFSYHIFFSCRREKNNEIPVSQNKFERLEMRKLEKRFVVGDFNGDDELDTLFQHNYSNLNKKEIDSSPDPYLNEWEDVVDWFFKQESRVYLSMNRINSDTLYLTTAQGLNCLINIGDNNLDGKDEVALVVDLCDFSRINSCKIYTICENKWIELKQFGILEDAFDHNKGEESLKNKEVKGYLEKHNEKWFYKDNELHLYETEEEIDKMKELKIEKCE